MNVYPQASERKLRNIISKELQVGKNDRTRYYVFFSHLLMYVFCAP